MTEETEIKKAVEKLNNRTFTFPITVYCSDGSWLIANNKKELAVIYKTYNESN